MTNKQLSKYLLTQNPDAEVTAWTAGRIYSIVDVHDTELILKPYKNKNEQSRDNE